MPATRYINLFHRTFWPVLALLVCLVIWLMAVSRADAELDRADVQVTREAAAFADAYEQYLTRSVGQMDQLTMQLKFGWEHRSSPDLLQDLRRDGMFTERHFLAVSIIDRHGVVRSALNRAVQAPALADSALFTGHRDSISSALHISAAAPALGLAPNTVLFTRRLDTADDDFDGIVVLAVDARYFTTFADAGTLGSHGIVAVAGAGDSAFRLEQRGDGTLASGAAATQLPLDGANASQGTVQIIDALEVFGDGIARTVGWRRSSAYPLMAAVALSRADAEAPARQYWRNARDNALGATICLAVLASLSAMLAARAAARMREQEEVRSAYRTATESAKDGFYMATPIRDRQGDIVDFRIVDCNERGANFYGLERAALVGRRLSQLDRAHFGDELAASYRLAMEAGFHEEDRRIPGEPHADLRWGHRRLVRVGNGLAITLQDVSERKAHEAQLERLANEDSLTGLPNRHWFMQHIGKAIEQARAARTEFGLLFIDLDEFKYVNDSQGHSVGDLLLKAAADRLSALLRPTDHVVRYGGDEFIVFLSPTEGDLQIAAVAARIVSAFSRPFALAGDIQLVGASVGISVYPRDGTDAESLIKHSDIAMYAGKSEGKGQLRFFNPALSAGLQTQAQLKHGLSEAIACDQFILHYQPRVDTRSGELLSMEALLRWRHPQLGMVPPLDFIPLAEASGQIIQIGALVIDKACAQIARMAAAAGARGAGVDQRLAQAVPERRHPPSAGRLAAASWRRAGFTGSGDHRIGHDGRPGRHHRRTRKHPRAGHQAACGRFRHRVFIPVAAAAPAHGRAQGRSRVHGGTGQIARRPRVLPGDRVDGARVGDDGGGRRRRDRTAAGDAAVARLQRGARLSDRPATGGQRHVCAIGQALPVQPHGRAPRTAPGGAGTALRPPHKWSGQSSFWPCQWRLMSLP